MRTRIIMEEHYTGCQHSTIWFEWPYSVVLVLRNTFLKVLVSLVTWIAPSALLACFRKQSLSAISQTFG
jgi:hypothetical protein